MPVYAIQAGEGGPVKLGYASDPLRRLMELRVGNPEPLRMLGLIDGDQDVEAECHRRFADLRIRGEWFLPGGALLSFIAATARPVEQEPRGAEFDNPVAYIRVVLLKMTQAQLAKAIGVSQPTVSRWERGEDEPILSHLRRLRELCMDTVPNWSDAWLFDVPTEPQRAAS